MRSSTSSPEQSEMNMEQREPTKSCLKLDRISNLPSHVVEIILSHLPLREAVRTSVLSSNWRYRSAMLPHLVFDRQCVSTQNQITFVNVVDHVLLGHIGPIHKFKLSDPSGCLGVAAWDIDRWILHLSRNSIKEFILEIWDNCDYRIPSFFFSCQDVIHLKLSGCMLKPPPTFKGFRNLKILEFFNVTLAQDVFQNLLACCPLLERLTLRHVPFPHLKIDAPNLQFLDVFGDIQDVIFENTLNLVNVYIESESNVGQVCICDSSSNLDKFLVHLPHIQDLDIDGCFLQILAVGALSAKLPKPCLYLKTLCIRVNFNDPMQILTVLCLLRSSPAIQTLQISGDPAFEELEFPAEQEGQAALSEVKSLYGNWICPFTQLQLVIMSDISKFKAELDMIRFLLLNSPVLEEMVVVPAYHDGHLEFVKQLLRLRCASVHSEINYETHHF